MRQPKENSWLWILAFPLVIALPVLVAWFFRTELYAIFSSAQAIRSTILHSGPWAPLVFIGLQVIQVVVFFIPGEVVQIGGGYVFGLWFGTVLSFIGIAIGSLVNLLVARFLGRHFVTALFSKEKLSRFDALCSSAKAEAAFFFLFLIPGIPKDTLCFVIGLSSLGIWTYLGISMMGRLPGIVGSAFIGSEVEKGRLAMALGIAVAASLLFLVGLLFQKRIHGWIVGHFGHRSSGEPGGPEGQ